MWNLNGGFIKTFKGHKDWVSCIKFINGDQMVSCSNDGTIKLWNLTKSNCLKTFSGHTDIVVEIQLLSNSRLVSSSFDGNLRIWSLDSGECLKQIEFDDLKNGLKVLTVGQMKLLTHEAVLLSFFNKINVYSLNLGRLLKSFVGHKSRVINVDVLSDGKVISASKDKSIKIWNYQTAECLKTVVICMPTIDCMKVFQNDKIFIISSHKLEIWSLESSSCIDSLIGHSGYIHAMTLLSNEFLITGSTDETIKIWDLNTCACIKTYRNNEIVSSLEILEI